MTGAKIFSILDAVQGFWQVKLDEENAQKCAFNTPFGRYRFDRLPFGICRDSDAFHQMVTEMLEGLEGTEIYIGKILVWGSDQKEYDDRFQKVLERLGKRKLKLNEEKSKIGLSYIKYLGHIISDKGLQMDGEKIKAINEMPLPTDAKGMERFLGLVTYEGKFIPNLSEVPALLRMLTRKEIALHWDKCQQEAYEKLFNLITKSLVLAFYDPCKEVTMSADASKSVLGTVFLQGQRRIDYASKAENNYAQIKKELLALVFTCERFHQYIYGKPCQIETHHKPLQAIFKKPLETSTKNTKV